MIHRKQATITCFSMQRMIVHSITKIKIGIDNFLIIHTFPLLHYSPIYIHETVVDCLFCKKKDAIVGVYIQQKCWEKGKEC